MRSLTRKISAFEAGVTNSSRPKSCFTLSVQKSQHNILFRTGFDVLELSSSPYYINMKVHKVILFLALKLVRTPKVCIWLISADNFGLSLSSWPARMKRSEGKEC